MAIEGDDVGRTTEDGNGALEDILGAYLDRLNAGEMLHREDIEREHPAEAAEILERLEVFQKIGARADAEGIGTLGDYRLLRRVGRGGMGVVYEAWQATMDRRVALKVLPGGLLADLKAVARFEREARIAGKLQHPHIVGVHGMGVDANTPYYAMI
jgi:eukaryotic-like serine/threonine-protein kinase